MDTTALLQRDSIEGMIEGFEQRINSARQNPKIPKSKEILYEIMKEYFERIYYAREQGKKLAWVGLLFPPEIVLAMDIVPFVVEQYIIQLLASGRGYEYFDLYNTNHSCFNNIGICIGYKLANRRTAF